VIWAILLILLLPLLLAPFETAGWWMQRRHQLRSSPVVGARAPAEVRAQLVYFTGVAGYSGEFLARREAALLERIGRRFPQLSVHSEVFPYSVNNNPLNGERVFAWLWEWLHRWRLRVPNNVFDALIVARNIGQLLVSADPRYGPFYNKGLAEVLRARLDPELPTVFLAYSGGAQMAIGAAGPYLQEHTAPLHLVALGGVFTDDPGITRFHSVTQLVGSRDRYIVRLGGLLFPGMWRAMFWSAWNRYRRSPRFQVLLSGPHAHVGKRDYFSLKPMDGQSGPSYADTCFQVLEPRLAELLSPYLEVEVESPPALSEAP
jgi:hypothetical protein